VHHLVHHLLTTTTTIIIIILAELHDAQKTGVNEKRHPREKLLHQDRMLEAMLKQAKQLLM